MLTVGMHASGRSYSKLNVNQSAEPLLEDRKRRCILRIRSEASGRALLFQPPLNLALQVKTMLTTTTTTRSFRFQPRQEKNPAFSGLKNAPQKIMLLLLCCITLATAAPAPAPAPAALTIALPTPLRALVMPAAFVLRGSLPRLTPAAQTRRPSRQGVQQRRDGGTVSFFSTSQGSTTTTVVKMATRHGYGIEGRERGRRRTGGGGEAAVIRSRVPPSSLSTSSPRYLGSAVGALPPRAVRSAVGVLWGVGSEVGDGRDGRDDDESEINERDGNDDVDVRSEQNSLKGKELVDGTRSTGGTSTGASLVDNFSYSDGQGPSTPPPPLAFGETEVEKMPPIESGEEASSRRGRSDSTDWMPQLFPPAAVDDDNDSFIKPLIELPLDGILLQLFPALLIGVLGLFLTFAVQMQASRFDGMVGEDGGAVVVTDLRDTRKAEP